MDVFSLHFSTVVFSKEKVKNFKVGISDVELTELSESNIKFPGKCTYNKLYMVFSKKRAFFNFFFLISCFHIEIILEFLFELKKSRPRILNFKLCM